MQLSLVCNFHSHRCILLIGSQEECKKALSHLQRILVVKSAMFQMDDPNRRKPRYSIFFVMLLILEPLEFYCRHCSDSVQ